MVDRVEVELVKEKGELLWFLETQPGGRHHAVSALPITVIETGVFFLGGLYRSFTDVFLTSEDAERLAGQ